MVFSANSAGWAQSGHFFYNGVSCWKHFAQQRRNAGQAPKTKEGACVAAGQLHGAIQGTVWSPAHNQWEIQSGIDNTIFLQSTWSQFVYWTTPFVVSFAGETHHVASDVPGYSTSKTDFSLMTVQNWDDDTFYGTCGFVTLYPHTDPRYATDAPACNHVRVWTSG